MKGWIGWIVSFGVVAVVCVLLTSRLWGNLIENWRDFTSYQIKDQTGGYMAGNNWVESYKAGDAQYHKLYTRLFWILLHPVILGCGLAVASVYGLTNVCTDSNIRAIDKELLCGNITFFQWFTPIFTVIACFIEIEVAVGDLMYKQARRERRERFDTFLYRTLGRGIVIRRKSFFKLLFPG